MSFYVYDIYDNLLIHWTLCISLFCNLPDIDINNKTNQAEDDLFKKFIPNRQQNQTTLLLEGKRCCAVDSTILENGNEAS